MERPNKSDMFLYKSADGNIKIGTVIQDDTVWTTQKNMGKLFGVDVRTISEHIQNVFKTGELDQNSVIRKFRITASDGKEYLTSFYSLDVIIAVGYRVNSYQATQFRIWATKVLKEYLVKGFVLDDDRLKQSKRLFDKDYFDELLERIREIRASERRFYQKITDIYAQCSADYDPNSPTTQNFFAMVQNKLEYAITHHTAAELIKSRAHHTRPHMGLETWKDAPKGKILKGDVSVAKNYLSKEEISELNRIVTMYLDFAELQATRQRYMKMEDWVEKLDAFLRFNEYDVLNNLGSVSASVAKATAESEYEKFRPIQDKEFESDFDKVIAKIKETKQLPKEMDTETRTNETTKFDETLKGLLSVKPEKNK